MSKTVSFATLNAILDAPPVATRRTADQVPDTLPAGWEMAPHLCRDCFGRILVSGSQARCSNCGKAGEGGPTSVCACNVKLKTGVALKLRCQFNSHRTLEFPGEIVAVPVADGAATAGARP